MRARVPALLATLALAAPSVAAAQSVIGGCQVLPTDNAWNVPVDGLPVHARSAAWVGSIGAATGLHMDFGSGEWPPGSGHPIGIPYTTVGAGASTVAPTFLYDDESDAAGYPLPGAPIEGTSSGTDLSGGDRHVLVIDTSTCTLYETWCTWPPVGGRSARPCGANVDWCTSGWCAGSGAVFPLASNALRTDGWTSADAAGLPVLPGLVRYEEVAAGEIRHALRFTAALTQMDWVWPARHQAGDSVDPDVPPMGARFRLKASFDVSGYSPAARVILRAMKTYGLILADNGSDWYVSGSPHPSWDNDVLHELDDVVGSDFEAVDTSSLQIDPDSGATPFLFRDGFETGGTAWWSGVAIP